MTNNNIYIADNGHTLKLIKREGETVTVLDLTNSTVGQYHIDWLMDHCASLED